MDTLIAWLKSKNSFTHSIGVLGGVVAVVLTDNAYGSRDALLQLFRNHPTLGSDLVILAGVIAAYKRSSSKAGTVAAAINIQAGPDAQTKVAIDAADTKTK